MGPQFSHVLSEMDGSGFRVLTSNEAISSEIEFLCLEASRLLEELRATEDRSLACQGKMLASRWAGSSHVRLP